MVARVVTPLWGDRWVPLKILNISDGPVTLQKNSKLADVCTCLALEDMEVPEVKCFHQATSDKPTGASALTGDAKTVQERVVHRNLLMLVNFLPVDSVSDHTSMSSFET